MSDQPAEPKPTAPASSKTSRVVLILLALNLGASGFATFKLVTAAEASPPRPAEAPPANEISGPVVALDPFVVNLDEPGTSRYLKVTIQLEVSAPEVEAAVEHSKQLVRDDVLSYLSGLHVKDTLGADGKDKIRKDLMAQLDKDVGPGKVRRMFFNEFVVQ